MLFVAQEAGEETVEQADRGVHAAGQHGSGQAYPRGVPHPRSPQATPPAEGIGIQLSTSTVCTHLQYLSTEDNRTRKYL